MKTLKQNRYFLIAFKAQRAIQKMTIESSFCVSTAGEYPNMILTQRLIHKQFQCSNAFITNIIELSEQDYIDYTKKVD